MGTATIKYSAFHCLIIVLSFFLGHTEVLSIEEGGTATACSPPAMLASYRSYCTEAAARFDDSKTKLAKESKCREEFLSKFSKNGSGKQMHTSSKGFLAPSGKLQRMVDAGVGGKGPFRAELM